MEEEEEEDEQSRRRRRPRPQDKHEITGTEPFLVGISPGYWAHVPLLIGDIVHRVQLKNGINCLPSFSKNTATTAPSNTTTTPWIPISKCVIVGYITNTFIRSDGSNSFVVDDGTGLMDCILWNNHMTNPNDFFYLPSLLDDDNDDADTSFQLGDLVRVYGKLNCLATCQTNESAAATTTKKEEETMVIREINVTLIEHVERPKVASSLNAEASHWFRCIEWSHNNNNNHQLNDLSYYLHQLGPSIQSQVFDKQNLPSATLSSSSQLSIENNRYAAWKVFGISCQCNLPYMSALLYCHCQAKMEPLDPQFEFRDALLNLLLEWQSKERKRLVVCYKTQIKHHSDLIQIATNVIQQKQQPQQQRRHTSIDILVSQLFLRTFRALRQDGILHLQDPDEDVYLLITRDKVLEPYVRAELEKQKELLLQQQEEHEAEEQQWREYKNYSSNSQMNDNEMMDELPKQNKRPKLYQPKQYYINHTNAKYLSRVHKERLQYIQRSITDKDFFG